MSKRSGERQARRKAGRDWRRWQDYGDAWCQRLTAELVRLPAPHMRRRERAADRTAAR